MLHVRTGAELSHMNTSFSRRSVLLPVLALAALGVLPLITGWHNVASQIATYLCLMLLPGLGSYLFVERGGKTLDAMLWALLASPLIVGTFAALMILSGVTVATTTTTLVVFAAVLGVLAAATSRPLSVDSSLDAKRSALLGGSIVLFCALAGFLPLTREWWRFWSDAWFHAAVVHEINTYGLPPHDPYFAGLELQYMWFYHVLVLAVSRATGFAPVVVMPLFNLQALAAFGLGAYLLTIQVKKRFAFGWMTVLCVVLAMNGLIWAFLPLKLARALIGETRGWDEVVRTYSLVPFGHDTVSRFLSFYGSPWYMINKFIVATALSFALGFMSAFWYGVVHYLSRPRVSILALILVSILGMFAMHPLFGFVTFAGLLGAFFLMFLARRRLRDFSMRDIVSLAVCALIGLILASPYLHSVMHFKQSGSGAVVLSYYKSVSILITCALVIILSAFQAARMWNERSMVTHFLLYSTAIIIVVCNLIPLPGYNAIEKPPFLVFYPLAIVGSWTLAEWYLRQNTTRSRAKVVVIIVLLLVPVNALALLGYASTPTEPWVTSAERSMSWWAQEETSRDAVFIDSKDRVPLLVTGPRRYYFGKRSYAEQWGYPKAIVEEREHVRENLYSEDPIDEATLAALGRIQNEVYVVARDTEADTNPTKLERYPSLFLRVYARDGISVWKVDRAACLEATGN